MAKGGSVEDRLGFEDLGQKGINVEEGIGFTGSREKYLAALQRFYRRAEKNIESIMAESSEKKGDELTITVHALKSNARMIGADRLGAIAEEMELSAKAGEYDKQFSVTDELLSEYRKVLDIIKPYGEMQEVHPASEISADEAAKAGEALIEALEDYDDEAALEQLHTLMHYPFRFTLINVLKNAEADIKDFEYTEALLKVRRVVSQIED
ncbi:MAG: Hpt domain-containing protein [Lachnospiraceae bacterium]|nr:Hpt domain-containing protein [Lachnospiraceae bacterium]